MIRDISRRWVRLGIVCGAAALAGAGLVHAQSVGQRVKVWVSGDYYTGTVVEVGSGDHAGQYRIHFDKFSSEQYALAKNVVALGAAPAPARGAAIKGSNGCRIMVINGLAACDPATVRHH